MKAIDNYFKARQEIFDYFEYVEDWRDRPIDDCRQYFWKVDGDNLRYAIEENFDWGDSVGYDVYSDQIIGKIMVKDDLTMIAVDTECDGNQFLRIFDNKQRIE